MVDITNVVAFLIDGLARGVVFAVLGLSITLIFGLGGILNLTVGLFAVIAVITASHLLGFVPNLAVAFLGSLVVVSVLGVAVDRSLLSLVYRSEGEERILLGIFVTLGLALFLEGLLFIYFPSSYTLSLGLAPVRIGDLIVRGSSIAVIGIAAALLGVLYLFLGRTYPGQATRTVIQDETGAILCGIDTRRIRSLVFVLSLVLAGIAGILYSFTYQIEAAASINLSIYAIIVSIVGGVTSITGTVVAGILLGVLMTFTSAYIGAYVSQVVLFAVVVAVLIARPEQIT